MEKQAEEGRVREEKRRRKKMQAREKVEKSQFTVFFQWFVAPEGRKVGSLKRRVRSHLARGEMNKCTPLWREAHVEVKMYKTPQCRTALGSWHVEKVHAIVARSTFPSQNAQSTSVPRVRPVRSGSGQSSAECPAYPGAGPLLEVDMSKKCTPSWREAHSQVKSEKQGGPENPKARRHTAHFF